MLNIWGRADRTHRRSDPHGSLRLAPRGRLVELEGVGHFPDLEQPTRFEEEVMRFVEDEEVWRPSRRTGKAPDRTTHGDSKEARLPPR